jgi:Protein of unknown function (DUF3047)
LGPLVGVARRPYAKPKLTINASRRSPMPTEFRSQLESLTARLPVALRNAHIANAKIVELPGNQPPWHATGVCVQRGQSYSLFANGRIQWSAAHPARFGGPKFHLWARVSPGGRIVNLTQNTATFVADTDGEIELGIYMGMWKNVYGELATSHQLYQRLEGSLEAWLVAWKGTPASGLAAIARVDPTWFITSEMVRVAAPLAPPSGWSYLIETGEADIFSAGTEDAPVIRLDADDDQGIITYPAAILLTPDTTLSWRWRGEVLPSDLAEDTVHTHDYFSIGTEFDNGRDLTWIWSSSLPCDYHFQCPTKAWTQRETHWVVRTGTAALGEWQHEQRNVFADVAAAMGPPPSRIVRVWLIAVTSFQHRRARATFANIVLRGSGHEWVVL